MSEPDAAKIALYQYIRDQHDKLIGTRQGQKARLNIFLALMGFLLAALCTFGLPSIVAIFEHATTAAATMCSVPYAIAVLPVIPLVFLLYFLTQGVRAIISVLGHVGIAVVSLNDKPLTQALEMKAEDLPGDYVIKSISKNYLKAIAKNDDDNYLVGQRFAIILYYTRRAAIAGLVLLVAVFAARIALTVSYPRPTVSVSSTKGNQP